MLSSAESNSIMREIKFNKFAVNTDYSSEIVSICKSIQGFEWDPENRFYLKNTTMSLRERFPIVLRL
jgi:hypothetical protein